MMVNLVEPGELVRTIDAMRYHIRTYVVNEAGDLVRYDDGLWEATRDNTTALDSKVADQ